MKAQSERIEQSLARAHQAGVTFAPQTVELLREEYGTGSFGALEQKVSTLSASRPGKTAVAYSGHFEAEVHTGAVAIAIFEEGQSYRIDETEVGAYLNEEANWAAADRHLDQKLRAQNLPAITDSQRRFTHEPAWRAVSERFATEAQGHVVCVVRDPDEHSAFVGNELPILLENDKIESINGVPRHELAASAPALDEVKRRAGELFGKHAERVKQQRVEELERKQAKAASLDTPEREAQGMTSLADSSSLATPAVEREAELRQIAKSKALNHGAEIKPAANLGKREITGKVLGYTADQQSALFERTGGGLVALDTAGKPPLRVGKQIELDVKTGTISRSGLSR